MTEKAVKSDMLSIKLLNNAIYLAWMDTKARYKKSVLGPLWLTLGNLIGVVGLSVVWSSLLHEDKKIFIPSVTIGLILWQIISATLTEAPAVFIKNSRLIKDTNVPPWFFIVRGLARNIINLAHNLIIIIGVSLYFESSFDWKASLSLLGLILVLFNLFMLSYILAIIGARFHDVEYFVNAFMPLVFFISPVIFRADQLPAEMNLIWYNPISYFIEVIRAPLLGKVPAFTNYVIILFLCMLCYRLLIYLNKKIAGNLTFWI
jgi:ABC-type polysaccharide/polyol phosphate export permease